MLLSNRTWPDGQNQAIKELRPRFHDSIVSTLLPEVPLLSKARAVGNIVMRFSDAFGRGAR